MHPQQPPNGWGSIRYTDHTLMCGWGLNLFEGMRENDTRARACVLGLFVLLFVRSLKKLITCIDKL